MTGKQADKYNEQESQLAPIPGGAQGRAEYAAEAAQELAQKGRGSTIEKA